MAQQDAFNRKATYQALSARLSRYNALVEDVFDELNKEAAAIATAAGYQGAGKFSWKDYPSTTSRVKKLQQQFIDDIGVVISSATSSEWQRSNAVQDSFVTNVLRSYGAKTDDDRAARYFKPNSDALAAFKKRKERGLGLSDRLWDLSSGYSDEICAAISCAIGKGTSAIELSHELSRYLLNFDELKADYQDLYGDATDIKNCEYRAARLARTEINMAYRSAENERWAQMDFIVGFEVKTTQNGLHQEDVCDTLAGKYPKDFVWTGWHPNCMCYKVPILKTEEEFWAWDGSGEPSADSINAVKDTPGSFRAWVQENKGRVAKAKEAGTLPYFIRDNKKYLTRALRTRIPTQQEREDILKRWNERRENNDAEIAAAQKFVADFFSNKYDVVLTGGRQGAGHLNYAIKSKNIDDIRKWKTLLEEDMAAARKAYLEQAAETLRMAADYIEIDTAYLKAAMAGDNMQYVSSCAQAIQSKISELQTKGAAFSNLIPDVNSLFKKFTYDQIEQTYNAISRKLASLNDLSKFDKAIALGYEAEYVANPTKYDESATKYPTWEVAQKAYEKLAADYEYSYHKDKWDDKLAPIKQWAATHKTVDAIEAAISEAERAISSRVDYKIVNKMVYNAMCLYDNCVKASLAQSSQRARRVFVPDDYTAARKDAAIWCKSESESMAEFEKQSNVNWAGLSKGARDAWAEYTKGSDGFNRPLRGFDGSWKSYAFKGAGSVDLNNEGRAQQIRDLYDAVENASMAKDTWLQRGTSEDTVCSLFGVNDIDELKGKIGEVATDFAFVSCGSAKGTGSCSRVTINIYCPKGTKALYLNPHSAYQGFNENETILQVGTKLRLVKVETKGDLTYLDVDVVGYDKHPLL